MFKNNSLFYSSEKPGKGCVCDSIFKPFKTFLKQLCRKHLQNGLKRAKFDTDLDNKVTSNVKLFLHRNTMSTCVLVMLT